MTYLEAPTPGTRHEEVTPWNRLPTLFISSAVREGDRSPLMPAGARASFDPNWRLWKTGYTLAIPFLAFVQRRCGARVVLPGMRASMRTTPSAPVHGVWALVRHRTRPIRCPSSLCWNLFRMNVGRRQAERMMPQ